MIYIASDTDYIDDVGIDIKSVVFWLFQTGGQIWSVIT